jgi:PAS domain S-box-containing protein
MPDSNREASTTRHAYVWAMLDSLPDGLLELDRDWRCRYSNAALETILGRRSETVLGHHVSDVLGRSDRGLLARIQRAWEEQRPDVVTWTSPMGGAVTVHVRPRPDGTALVLRRDVASEAKCVLDERLEVRLLHAQRLEVMGRIAGGIAHDFNNLLTVINVHCEFVQADLPPGSAPLLDMKEVMQAADSAAKLTRQLLAFTSKQVLQPQWLDVNATITRIVGMLRRVIGEDVRIEMDLAPAACAVLADSARLEQVVMNLAMNARDAMPHGGVLRLRTAPVAIDAGSPRASATLPAGQYVSIVVEDTGVGISPQSIGRIFDAFYSTKAEGTGLGLAMVLSIVEKLGGDVRVESARGEGSRFTVLLPCLESRRDEAVAARETMEMSTSPPPHGVESIMIVEDEPGVRGAARRMLERLGYSVHEAATGAEAYDLVARLSTPPDLVLVDVVMPGESGRVVADRLLRQWPAIRVLFMSGYAADELLRRGIAVPSETMLEKPITGDLLGHAVRRALDGRGSL